jgi:hypothetical protein
MFPQKQGFFPIVKAVEDTWEQDPEENAIAQAGGSCKIMETCIMRIFIIYILFVYIRSIYQSSSSSGYTL